MKNIKITYKHKYMNINNLLDECKKYDLIGIDELTHGELTS